MARKATRKAATKKNAKKTRARSTPQQSSPAKKDSEIVFVEQWADLKKYGPSGPPPDRMFFLPMRLFSARMTGKLDKPYQQNVWVYAANQAIALPISSLPFVVFREQRNTRELRRERRVDALKEILPALPDRWGLKGGELSGKRGLRVSI